MAFPSAVLPAAALPAAALGRGGGLAHLILRLFIWRAIWRLGLLIWHVPTIGPGLFLLIVAVLLGLAGYRSRRGAWRRPRARYRGGTRPDRGPRDW